MVGGKKGGELQYHLVYLLLDVLLVLHADVAVCGLVEAVHPSSERHLRS